VSTIEFAAQYFGLLDREHRVMVDRFMRDLEFIKATKQFVGCRGGATVI
jgi:hypothetical protein